MTFLKIITQSLNDVEEGRGRILPEGTLPEDVTDANGQMTVAIQEAGTTSGKTTLMFILPLGEGKFIKSELTAGLFRGIAMALEGAEARFADEKSNRTSSTQS